MWRQVVDFGGGTLSGLVLLQLIPVFKILGQNIRTPWS